MANQLESLMESIKSKVRSLKKKKAKKPYLKMEKSSSVKVEIRSRKARKLIEKNLKAADSVIAKLGISVEHLVAHVHTQNGLAESLIKRLQLIARPLLLRAKLPISVWGHAILHAANIIRIRPPAYHKQSPQELVLGQVPNISHLKVFGCAVYVPISPPQRTKMGPQRRIGIYVGFDSPSIIRYMEPLNGDVFTIRNIVKSYIPAVNAPAKIEIPENKSISAKLIEVAKVSENILEVVLPPEEVQAPEMAVIKLPNVGLPPEENVAPEVAHAPELENVFTEAKVPKNYEISMNYVHNAKLLDRESIEVDDVYAFCVTSDIIMNSDLKPQSVEEYRHREDWPKWKIAIQEEWQSLREKNIFGPVVQTPAGVVPIGNRWETYSPVMDGVTFRFLMGMACMEKLETRLMDVVTAYLYGSLDSDFYMKIPEGLNIEDTKPRHLYSVKLQRSLYGLKQSGRMWYNRFSEYLLNDGYVNNQVCPCIFIKRSSTGFVIIAVYVDDLNIIGTTEDITDAANYLKNEFEMKDLGRTRFCLGIQVEHLSSGIFVHQSNYTEKILDRFYMDKAHPLTIPMVVRSLEVEKDPFHPRKQDEEALGPEVPYLSIIGALMYLTNNTRPDIEFAVNLLAIFSSDSTKRH
ncbi:hypothetical protein AgCh_030429 [Apium graveolens]